MTDVHGFLATVNILTVTPRISLSASVPLITALTTATGDDHAVAVAIMSVLGRARSLRAARGGTAMGLTASAAAATLGGGGTMG